MIEPNQIQLISTFFIGLGVTMMLFALMEAFRPKVIRLDFPVAQQKEICAPEPMQEIQAKFKAMANYQHPVECESIDEIPTEYIRPGDLLETVKIPAFVQTFKFREKTASQTNARA